MADHPSGLGDAESRALIPAQSSRHQQSPSRSLSGEIGAPTPAQPGDDTSSPDQRTLWRQFEATKETAIFHLDEVLQHREILNSEVGVQQAASFQSARPNDRRVPKSFWDFKVAKDNLLNDLDILCRLLDHMSGKSKKGLAQLYGLLLLLVVAAKLLDSGTATATKAARGAAYTVLGIVSGFTAFKTIWLSSANLCKHVVERMYDRAEADCLHETDKDDFQSVKFKFLWWTSYLSIMKR